MKKKQNKPPREKLIDDDGRVRVRLEFFAWPNHEPTEEEALRVTNAGLEIRPDRHITALDVMLFERFGDEGRRAFNDWAERCAMQTFAEAERFSRGAERMHAKRKEAANAAV